MQFIIVVSRFALIWDVTQRIWVVNRSFGTVDPRKMGPVSPETSVTANLRCVTSLKSEHLIYTSAEAWNHTQ